MSHIQSLLCGLVDQRPVFLLTKVLIIHGVCCICNGTVSSYTRFLTDAGSNEAQSSEISKEQRARVAKRTPHMQFKTCIWEMLNTSGSNAEPELYGRGMTT
jgi:hypothetical protein